ncbi:hypothetical protein INR49_020336 [Caranx melampygus]|nr:hypothetical protein INR49_020336 [Caranx melampygus]
MFVSVPTDTSDLWIQVVTNRKTSDAAFRVRFFSSHLTEVFLYFVWCYSENVQKSDSSKTDEKTRSIFAFAAAFFFCLFVLNTRNIQSIVIVKLDWGGGGGEKQKEEEVPEVITEATLLYVCKETTTSVSQLDFTTFRFKGVCVTAALHITVDS